MPDTPQRKWFQRSFALGLPVDTFPELVERLRGTPLRLEERIAASGPGVMTRPRADTWSALEHAGHLSDLEELWRGRIEDLRAGTLILRAADLENRATWDADHNARVQTEVLAEFRSRRQRLIALLEEMKPDTLLASARHPRLEQAMTTVDLCFFVAEHDDHHLAAITALL